jgi:uracil phosphoribosyltransferase
MQDIQYSQSAFKIPEMEHRYGNRVHLISDPFLFSILARLCAPECTQPWVNMYLDTLYRGLLRIAVNASFPTTQRKIKSRMHSMHPEGEFEASVLDTSTKAVCVNLARAGTVPSQLCYDSLNYLLDPQGVRQDHIAINRKVDESERVIGTNLAGVKIGGDINDSYLLIPDPMGATGSTIDTAMEVYSKHGTPKAVLALHLIVTPEYLRHLVPRYPNLHIFALRLDRGLSPKDVLQTVPGTHWDREKGLNAKHYIVPGAGGLGEVINNAYV